ncbi:hypothetical protein PPYR_14170 [Photinus pyralis]|uniref:Wbp11/ELF5/Saf1 N-terminal domain-containing protein n=3 Tax=Photinus pyralis TaxID=7054 RepID=A0A5N4A4I2_PHOPY|nr:WW domain-binding protein 11 [Photinus pyralis]KAB0792211.1 hypothetical protein PPYR_14170 [Photinus pyralis]
MGRRSINTTKSGKYMNPTDQARKEARKLELKKNKKQRQMVRAAVLKGKDPIQILDELEKIDQMEFNVTQPSPLNEKVLKDKRKKLRDTLERVLNMYYRDDPDKWTDLKRKQADYEHKRNQIVAFYESVKTAQQVSVDEIPLPQMPEQLSNLPAQIPLPTEIQKPQHTIYSIATALKLQALGHTIREPAGCPPGPPPEINSDGEDVEYAKHLLRIDEEIEEYNSDSSVEDSDEDGVPSKPTSVQQKMVALSGQNIDDFMKEMESVHKKQENDKDDDKPRASEPLAPPGTDPLPTVPAQTLPQPQIPAPPALIFPAPLRLPPGPPPGRPLLPPGPPPGLPHRIPLRMPPAPPRMIRLPGPPPNLSLATPNVLSAGPQLIRIESGIKQGATISAKPQIRNLSADVTRFVPSALRVKREDKKPKSSSRAALANELKQKEMLVHIPSTPTKQLTKDDAYMQFMKEMQGLI